MRDVVSCDEMPGQGDLCLAAQLRDRYPLIFNGVGDRAR
jgi:hypothetical protein